MYVYMYICMMYMHVCVCAACVRGLGPAKWESASAESGFPLRMRIRSGNDGGHWTSSGNDGGHAHHHFRSGFASGAEIPPQGWWDAVVFGLT